MESWNPLFDGSFCWLPLVTPGVKEFAQLPSILQQNDLPPPLPASCYPIDYLARVETRCSNASDQSLNRSQPIDYVEVDAAVLPSPDSFGTSSPYFNRSSDDKFTFEGGDRSPSIGIVISPSDGCESRCNSSLHCFLAQNSNDYPPAPVLVHKSESDNGSSSQTTILPYTPSQASLVDECTEADDLKNWQDWGIQTAPGCPPLKKLFENKQRWREQFNSAVPPEHQRHCVFCRSIDKPASDYLSHTVRDEAGNVVCPILRIYQCPNCGKKGHTIRYCTEAKASEMNRGRKSVGQRTQSDGSDYNRGGKSNYGKAIGGGSRYRQAPRQQQRGNGRKKSSSS